MTDPHDGRPTQRTSTDAGPWLPGLGLIVGVIGVVLSGCFVAVRFPAGRPRRGVPPTRC